MVQYGPFASGPQDQIRRIRYMRH